MENQNEASNENVINLLDIIYILRKNVFKMFVVGLAAAIVMFCYTKTIPPVYQSNAKMVLKVITSESLTTYSDVQIAVGLVNDCVEIIKSRQLMQEVIDKLGLDYTPDVLLSNISITVPADTRVLRLSVNDTDPETAQKIAEAVCELAESSVASSVGVDSIKTFERPSTPIYPVSPNVYKNTILGAIFGALVVAAFEIVKMLLNNRIYTPDDVENQFGLSVFASIPYIGEDDGLKRRTRKKAHSDNAGEEVGDNV